MLNQHLNNCYLVMRSLKHERKNMNHQFDELTKGLAQSVTRRAALKKFGVGLAGMALACLGLTNKAEANWKTCLPSGTYGCRHNGDCCSKQCVGGFEGFPKFCA